MRHALAIGSEGSATATEELAAPSDAQPDEPLAVEERDPSEDLDEEPLGWLISLLIEENARQ